MSVQSVNVYIKKWKEHIVPRMSDIGQAIIRAKPRIISICEITPEDKRAEKMVSSFIRGVARLSVITAAERKFGLHILKEKVKS